MKSCRNVDVKPYVAAGTGVAFKKPVFMIIIGPEGDPGAIAILDLRQRSRQTRFMKEEASYEEVSNIFWGQAFQRQ